MVNPQALEQMNAQQLRDVVLGLIGTIQQQDAVIADKDQIIVARERELLYRKTKLDQLTQELALHRRWKFGRSSEQLSGEQANLLDEALDADIAAMEEELAALAAPTAEAKAERKQQPKRAPLPENLPRTEFRHEPDSTTCNCGCELKRIGEDVSEKLDYEPGNITVERHIRGKWACAHCQTITMAPVPPQVIDKGIPTAGLLAQVLVAKYADHLPLYRQEQIFGRAGVAISRSTLAQWVGVCGVQLQPLVDALRQAILARSVLHADETPVQMLKPGTKKTHRAYLWAYAPSAFDDLKAVVYDFAESRSGEHARNFVGDWRGSLVCDDFSGYVAAEDMLCKSRSAWRTGCCRPIDTT